MQRFARILSTCVLSLAAACGSSSEGPNRSGLRSRHAHGRLRVATFRRRAHAGLRGVATGTPPARRPRSSRRRSRGREARLRRSPIVSRGSCRCQPASVGSMQFAIPDRPGNPLYTPSRSRCTVDDAAGHRGEAEASGAVKDYPSEDPSADRTTMAAGETRRCGGARQARPPSTRPVAAGPMRCRTEGSIAATPCPASRLRVRTLNPSGEIMYQSPSGSARRR